MNKKFTTSEKRVMSAMFKLDRFATVNEIADWADDMSWNTARSVLIRLHARKIVSHKLINGRANWKMKEF